MIGFAIHKSLANPNRKLAFLSCFHCYMGSKFLLKPTSSTVTTPFPSPNKQQYHTLKRLLPVRCSSKPTYKINPSLLSKTNGFSFSPLAAPVGSVPEVLKSKLEILRLKLAEMGIELDHFAPGQYNSLLCPTPFASARSTHATSIKLPKAKQMREISEQGRELEQLCNEVVIAFTYRRNGVHVSASIETFPTTEDLTL